MQCGTCTFRVKALNAQAAGASAAVIFNRGGGENGPINGTLGSPGVAIPTIGVSFAVGGELFSTDSSVVAHVFTSTGGGRAPRLGHGRPGRHRQRERRRHDALTPAQRAAITININVDMLSSSNGVYFVQDGDGAHTGGPMQPGRSAELEHVLTSYLESQGLPWVARPYDGRSDYQSFINAGICGGGLTTGSDQVKTPAQAALFGGTAGITMHPTYHTAADRLEHVNMKSLDDMSDAACTRSCGS
jgi:Peptidase family M28/PA domain